MGQFSTGSHIVDQSAHCFIGFEAWTYPWLAPLFWIYQSTDSGDNTLDRTPATWLQWRITRSSAAG